MPLLQTGASPQVGLASDQELSEPFGTAKGVHGFQFVEHGRGFHVLYAVAVEMVAGDDKGQFPVFFWRPQAVAQALHQFGAALLVAAMTGPLLPGCRGLAQVMRQGGEQRFRLVSHFFRLLQHQHRVDAAVDLRVIFLRLRNAKQVVDLRKDLR